MSVISTFIAQAPSIWGATEINGMNNLYWGVDSWGAGIAPPVTLSAVVFTGTTYIPGAAQFNQAMGVAMVVGTIWGADQQNGFNNFYWGVTPWGGYQTTYTAELQTGGP